MHVIFVKSSPCIFCKCFVGITDNNFPKACFVNDVSAITNLNNLPSGISDIKLPLSIAQSEQQMIRCNLPNRGFSWIKILFYNKSKLQNL